METHIYICVYIYIPTNPNPTKYVVKYSEKNPNLS